MNATNFQHFLLQTGEKNEQFYNIDKFKNYIKSDRIIEALKSIEESMNFDRAYLLVIKSNQKIATFPHTLRFIEGKKQLYSPEVTEQLIENGYIYINQNMEISCELQHIMKTGKTKEFCLYPIFSAYDGLTFLCCSRETSNPNGYISEHDITCMEKISIEISECIDRLYFRFNTNRCFA